MAAPVQIGPFRVLRTLGQGGMGVVFEVQDPKTGRSLALKQILARRAGGGAIQRFMREAHVLARVDHPHVVRVHTLGQAEQGPYLATDLIEGEELAEVLTREGPLDPLRAARIMADVTSGVAALHAVGVVHRDLKPQNIMLRADDERPVLIDLGLALDDQSEGKLTQTGQIMGTPAYLSPEQAMAQREQIGPRTDVYGLGAVLYALLSGHAPHSGPDLMALIVAVVKGEPEWPSETRGDVPAALEDICRKAMAREVDDRYASAAELEQALREFLESGSLEGRSSKRIFGALLGLLAVVLAVLGWVAASGRSQPRSAPAPTDDPSPIKAASPTAPALDEARDTLKAEPQGSPGWFEAARVLYPLLPPEEAARLRLRYTREGLEHPRALTPFPVGTRHGTGRAYWLPDGRIAAAFWGGRVDVFDPAAARGTLPIRVFTQKQQQWSLALDRVPGRLLGAAPGGAVLPFSWTTPDSVGEALLKLPEGSGEARSLARRQVGEQELLAVGTTQGQVFVYDLAKPEAPLHSLTGGHRAVVSGRLLGSDRTASEVDALGISPSGRWLVSAAADRQIVVWDLRDERRRTEPTLGTVSDLVFHPTRDEFALSVKVRGRVAIYDAATLKLLRECTNVDSGVDGLLAGNLAGSGKAHANGARGVRYSPDGSRLYSVSGAQPSVPNGVGELIVWDPETGKPLVAPKARERCSFLSVDLTADGSRLATFDRLAETVEVWEIDLPAR